MAIPNSATERLSNEKFEGCVVVPLNDQGEAVLETVRCSPLNRRVVLYGVLETDRPSAWSTRLGVNVIFRAPIERLEAVQRVRSSAALLIHELRRYVRVPLVIPVSIEADGRSLAVMSREISGGGMSVELAASDFPDGKCRVVFALPDAPRMSVSTTLAWKNDHLVGLRFEDADEGRLIVREWIDKWLGIGSNSRR